MKRALALVLLLYAPQAQAQETSFVPVTLTETDYNQLMQFVQDLPYKSAAPIVAFFMQKEAAAQAAKKPVEDKVKK